MINKQNIIIAVIALIAAFFIFRSCDKKNAKIESQASVISEQTAKIITVKVKGDKEAFEKTRAIADLKTLTESYNFLSDTLKAMKIKKKDLESALFLAQSTQGRGEGTVEIVTVTRDNVVVQGQDMAIREPFFTFNAITFPDKTFEYNYEITDSLSIVNTTTRKNIFSPWENNVRVLNANPKTKLKGITSLTVRNKEPVIVIGVSVGYGITPSGFEPFLGITATRPIIKF